MVNETLYRIEKRYGECKELWEMFVYPELVWDIWDVRDSFNKAFQRKPLFVIAEENYKIVGFLPLCIIPETNTIGFFPGETWHGKTWVEQNKIFAETDDILKGMVEYVSNKFPQTLHLRYILKDECLGTVKTEDEIGYLFVPKKYNYSMDEYYQLFSHKSAKRIKKDIEAVAAKNMRVEINNFDHFETLVNMNIERFGSDSYFSDSRFTQGFKNLCTYLKEKGYLRVTSVFLNDELAAVDFGSIFNERYTLLAGGTNANFPGVAKLINTLHMEYSCQQRFLEADFLCGDFSWKKIFHLEPRPLYKISNTDESIFEPHADADNILVQG